METGFYWMRGVSENFPLKSIKEIKPEDEENQAYEKEISNVAHSFKANAKTKQTKSNPTNIHEKISQRVQFSQYIVMPDKYRFKSAVRIFGIVYQFIFKFSRKLQCLLFAH